MDFRRCFYVFGRTMTYVVIPVLLFLFNLIFVLIDILERIAYGIFQRFNDRNTDVPNGNERDQDVPEQEDVQSMRDRRHRADREKLQGARSRNQSRFNDPEYDEHNIHEHEDIQTMRDRRNRTTRDNQQSARPRYQPKFNSPRGNEHVQEHGDFRNMRDRRNKANRDNPRPTYQPKFNPHKDKEYVQEHDDFQTTRDLRNRPRQGIQQSARTNNQSRCNPPEDNHNNTANRVMQLLETKEVDTVEQARIAINLINLQFSREAAFDAAKNCSSVESAVAYMNQDCESCEKTYSMSQMIYMLNCSHRCCESCAKSFFTMQITHHSVADCICPYCRLPDLKSDATSMYEKKDYFANLSVIFERVLNANVYKTYQDKLNAFLNTNASRTNVPSESSNVQDRNNVIPDNRQVIENESLQQSTSTGSRTRQNAPTEFDIMQRKLQELLQTGRVKDFAQGELVVTLTSMQFTEEQALDASKNCNTLDNAISYLNQNCSICQNTFSMSQMTSMLNCEHRFCRNCAKNHFTENITANSITDCTCPTCQQPDLENDEDLGIYLSNLDIMLKDLLDADVHEQFQQKLRDFSLRNDPNESVPLSEELKRQAQEYLADGRVRNYMQSELVVRLIQAEQSENDALVAVKHCSTIDGALAFLNQECSICADKFRMNQMVTMLNCEHRYCTDCAKRYFTEQINERPIQDCNCPECSLPDLNDQSMSETDRNYYFSNLDILLKNIVDGPVHDVFQKKLRDWSLSTNPNFQWCPQCSSGYIAEGVVGRIVCPDCRAITCVSCRKPWEDQHEGISCERFTEWKEANDPENQEAGVANHLAANGINCPKCKHRFSLARGGCMHFTCSQCRHEFCQGCDKTFSNRCNIRGCLLGRALHAHHPRNCLFYLRDKEPAELQTLLRSYKVPYDTARPANIPQMTNCSAMLQVSNSRDAYCTNTVEQGHAGLCRVHYIEYLGGLIKTNDIDSVDVLDIDYITYILQRNGIEVPKHDASTTTPQAYKELCTKIMKERMPLEKKSG